MTITLSYCWSHVGPPIQNSGATEWLLDSEKFYQENNWLCSWESEGVSTLQSELWLQHV